MTSAAGRRAPGRSRAVVPAPFTALVTGLVTVLLTVTAVTATAVTVTAAPARGTCGLTVTADYTLRSNLHCSGTAITVLASDPAQPVTLDLGGHAVIGDGTGSGVFVDAEMGGTVVVRNGQIRGFGAAVDGSGVGYLTFSNLTLRGNEVWLTRTFLEVRELTIERSRIVDSGVSGASTESTTTVRRSAFIRSGVSSPGETYTRVYDSTFVGGGVSTGIAANVIAERNTFRRCDVGLDAQDSWPFSPTVVRDNAFVGCRVGVQLEVSAAGSGPNGVTIARNDFRRNTEVGLAFTIHDPFGDVDIVGNRAVGNGGTGIAGTGAGVVTVSGNTALHNGGHGIDVSGVVDGGANVARGNAASPQCIGVVCSGGR